MTSTTALFLVEDDALIRDLLEASLTEAGFEVVEVSDGTKALAEFDADVVRFRAVITDIRLGAGPDGWAERRNAARPRTTWQFTTQDARIKLRSLYPAFHA